MSRHRHKAKGGGTREVWEAGGETNAAKEAEDKTEGSKGLKHGGHKRRHGGHVEGEGEHPKHGAHKRARGGHVEGGHHGKPHEMHHVKHHSMKHVPGRKRGGGVGANRTPLSTAANIKEVVKGEYAEDSPKND
jgi:hypothetical protein